MLQQIGPLPSSFSHQSIKAPFSAIILHQLGIPLSKHWSLVTSRQPLYLFLSYNWAWVLKLIQVTVFVQVFCCWTLSINTLIAPVGLQRQPLPCLTGGFRHMQQKSHMHKMLCEHSWIRMLSKNAPCFMHYLKLNSQVNPPPLQALFNPCITFLETICPN